MTADRFRDPGARERAWGQRYRRKGAAVVVTTDDRQPTEEERLAAWRAKHDRMPPEFRHRHHRFDFRSERVPAEPVDPDAYMLRYA